MDPIVGKLQEVPGRGLVNRELRLPVLKYHGDLASFVHGVDFKKAGVSRQRIQDVNRLAAQIVPANAAQDDGMIAETARHHREVGRRTAKPPPRRGPRLAAAPPAINPTATRLRPKSNEVLSKSCSGGARFCNAQACPGNSFLPRRRSRQIFFTVGSALTRDGLLVDSSRLLCGVWLVMVEIEEVPVRIPYGELP